jgi:hypothetical protein
MDALGQNNTFYTSILKFSTLTLLTHKPKILIERRILSVTCRKFNEHDYYAVRFMSRVVF